jgi:hypothetical protein
VISMKLAAFCRCGVTCVPHIGHGLEDGSPRLRFPPGREIPV